MPWLSIDQSWTSSPPIHPALLQSYCATNLLPQIKTAQLRNVRRKRLPFGTWLLFLLSSPLLSSSLPLPHPSPTPPGAWVWLRRGEWRHVNGKVGGVHALSASRGGETERREDGGGDRGVEANEEDVLMCVCELRGVNNVIKGDGSQVICFLTIC